MYTGKNLQILHIVQAFLMYCMPVEMLMCQNNDKISSRSNNVETRHKNTFKHNAFLTATNIKI